jgi:3-isopropylmalate/(R)-2-methylmalate dehydratase large subunit
MFEKVWNEHVVERLDEQADLIHIDRHLLHDLSGPFSMQSLEEKNLGCRRPELTFAFPDHGVSTSPSRYDDAAGGGPLLDLFRHHCAKLGIHLFDLGSEEQGIVHVSAPELGLALPGLTIVCGDSHTSTQGAFGALALGIGNTEVTQVLATQTLVLDRPRTMRLRIDGKLGVGVSAKDVALAIIARDGPDAGCGYAVEFAGSFSEALSLEGRMTLCNLSLEMGARFAFTAPDEATFEWLRGRRYAPAGDEWDRAVRHWRTLASETGAVFDREVTLDVASLAPQITWGTSPAHAVAIDARVPDPASAPDAAARRSWLDALSYMGLEGGEPLDGIAVQHVFIGSCTNSRLADLVEAARVVRGRKVAAGVRAWVVAGSRSVQREAVALGIDRVFRDAGFEWREPGCSMCIAMNGDAVPSGERAVSTSNRNFVGRQGPGARTHLASPATAAAAAVSGCIRDPRSLLPLA